MSSAGSSPRGKTFQILEELDSQPKTNGKAAAIDTIDLDWESDEDDGFDVDAVITKLLSVSKKNPGTMVDLDYDTISQLIQKAKKIIMNQPMLLRLKAPKNSLVVGTDIHGQYYDLLRFMSDAGPPPETNYLFLGDYVDRGKQSIETVCLLLAYKIKYPEGIFMLRGNHECQNISRIYGFFDECKRRHSMKLWKEFIDLFNIFPIAALIEDKILCMHGGLSPKLTKMQEINKIRRPTEVPDSGLMCDLLWADPATGLASNNWKVKKTGWGDNDRGTSYVFAEWIVDEFLKTHNLDLIVRGHQVMEDGYEFFAD